MMKYFSQLFVVALLALGLSACEPSDARPGFWLGGESQTFPEDWKFTDAVNEISIQVDTPYFLAHSVTIWCAQLDGTLYVGALDPESKMWPGWVLDAPNVKLKVADGVYDAELILLLDTSLKAKIAAKYNEKYQLPEGAEFAGDSSAWYWRVTPSK